MNLVTALAPAAPVSLEQLRRDLDQAKSQAMFLRVDLPDLARLRAVVAHHTSETLLDPDNKPALEAASAELKAAVIRHAESQAANRKVDELQAQLGDMQHQTRMAKIEDANKRLDAAVARYDAMARECCRAYAALLEAQNASHRVPGARTSIPDGPNFPHMTPAGWSGDTAMHIKDNSLHWLNAERNERMKVAA